MDFHFSNRSLLGPMPACSASGWSGFLRGKSPANLARLAKVGDLLQATQLVLLFRVRDSVTTGRRWVTNLPDYLRARS